MKRRNNLYSVMSLMVQFFLSIMSAFFGFGESELLIICSVIIVPLVCIYCNWSLKERDYNKNILFMDNFYNMNAIVIFLLLLVGGSVSTVFQFYFGNKYGFHHIINNVVTIPLTLTASIKYVSKLEKICKAISKVNEYKDKLILRLSPILLQMSLFYIIFFMKSQTRNPAKVEILGLYITTDGLNLIYLLIVMYLFLICLVYIILFFMANKSIDKYYYSDLFPKWPITGIVLFFVFWGCMAFYETENRIEIVYYVSGMFVACAILVVTILLWMKLNTFNGIKLFYYNTFLAVSLIIYCTIILYLEGIIKLSKVQIEGATTYSLNAIMVLVAITMIIALSLFKTSLEKKYRQDIKKHESSDNRTKE